MYVARAEKRGVWCRILIIPDALLNKSFFKNNIYTTILSLNRATENEAAKIWEILS
jgi:hypothetical protein